MNGLGAKRPHHFIHNARLSGCGVINRHGEMWRLESAKIYIYIKGHHATRFRYKKKKTENVNEWFRIWTLLATSVIRSRSTLDIFYFFSLTLYFVSLDDCKNRTDSGVCVLYLVFTLQLVALCFFPMISRRLCWKTKVSLKRIPTCRTRTNRKNI